MSQIKINRTELYNQIWKLSRKNICIKYGIKDTELKEVCKKMNIPLPDNKYWTNLRMGKEVQRSKLPDEYEIEEYNFIDDKSKEKNKIYDKLSFIGKDKASEIVEVSNNIKIPSSLSTKLNPIVEETKNYYKWEKEHEYSNSYASNPYNNLLRLFVEKQDRTRFYKWYDTLFKTIIKLGYIVRKDYRDFSIIIESQDIDIEITQKKKMITRELTEVEKRYRSNPNDKIREMVNSGLYKLKIKSGYYGKEWIETEECKIEDFIGEVIIEIFNIAIDSKKAEIKKQEEREKQRKIQEEYEKKLKIQENEKEKLEQLKQYADNYEQANKIRIFIEEFSRKNDLTEEQKHWIEWARLKADWLDPLVKCKDEILDEKLENPNRSWWY